MKRAGSTALTGSDHRETLPCCDRQKEFCISAIQSIRLGRGMASVLWAGPAIRLALLSALERRLGQESNMPVGGLLPVPVDGGDGSKDDPLAMLKKELKSLKGEFAMLETTSSGFGEGRAAAPHTDWKPNRLGAIHRQAFPCLGPMQR